MLSLWQLKFTENGNSTNSPAKTTDHLIDFMEQQCTHYDAQQHQYHSFHQQHQQCLSYQYYDPYPSNDNWQHGSLYPHNHTPGFHGRFHAQDTISPWMLPVATEPCTPPPDPPPFRVMDNPMVVDKLKVAAILLMPTSHPMLATVITISTPTTAH